jgi:ferredoxin
LAIIILIMTHVVTSSCVGHKYQDCVAVCPVDAFRELDTYLVIDPDECIDCAACVSECPVEAIFADFDLPEEHEEWLERNEVESADAPLALGDSPVLA